MNRVVYYSNTGKCKAVAEYIGKMLSFSTLDVFDLKKGNYEKLVIVFPILCQGIPKVLLSLLDGVKAEYVSIVACYGKMATGNAIYELQKKTDYNVVSACYVPTKHAYIADDTDFVDYEKLIFIKEKFERPDTVNVPKRKKNIFSNFFPILRSRVGIKLIKNSQCIGCNICMTICPHDKCIRCLRCVASCPYSALEYKVSPLLRSYLNKNKKDELIIYK